jgi:hypothetical protein
MNDERGKEKCQEKLSPIPKRLKIIPLTPRHIVSKYFLNLELRLKKLEMQRGNCVNNEYSKLQNFFSSNALGWFDEEEYKLSLLYFVRLIDAIGMNSQQISIGYKDDLPYDSTSIYSIVPLAYSYPYIDISQSTIFVIFIVCLMLGHKITYDSPINNKSFAKLSNISLSIINNHEIKVLSILRFNLHWNRDELEKHITNIKDSLNL